MRPRREMAVLLLLTPCDRAHHYVDPSFVALHASRGMESASLKLFMRWTVLVSDVLVYFAATGLFALVVSQRHHAGKELAVALLVLLLFQPSLILVDHGHFQYNAVMLGLTLAAIALVYRDAESTRVVDPQRIAGAVLFCLALLFKQMALYYALPFFFYLLGCAYKSARTVSTAHAYACGKVVFWGPVGELGCLLLGGALWGSL